MKYLTCIFYFTVLICRILKSDWSNQNALVLTCYNLFNKEGCIVSDVVRERGRLFIAAVMPVVTGRKLWDLITTIATGQTEPKQVNEES